jgi:hypothetical protein
MDEIITLEQWFELKSRLRQQYPDLTDADLQYHEASEKDMLNMVMYSLIKTEEVIQGLMGRTDHLYPLKNYWRYSRRHRLVKEIG